MLITLLGTVLLLFFLALLYPLISLLTTLLSFLFLRVFLRCMSVKLEKHLDIKFCEVGHKVPQVASPVSGLVLGHVLQQTVDVTPYLYQAATGVRDL